jgi:hypothetical protein
MRINVIHILLPGHFEGEDQVLRQPGHPVPLLPLLVLEIERILGILSLAIPEMDVFVVHRCLKFKLIIGSHDAEFKTSSERPIHRARRP